MFGAEVCGILPALLGSQPGSVIPVRSQQELQNYALRDQQAHSNYMQLQQQSQMIALEAQMIASNVFASAACAAARCTKRAIFPATRKEHRRRLFMRTTKAGYKARERCEVAVWIAVGTILLGGVVLPVGLRVYTSLWTWALGGG